MIRFHGDDDDTLKQFALVCAELYKAGVEYEAGRDGQSWYIRPTGY